MVAYLKEKYQDEFNLNAVSMMMIKVMVTHDDTRQRAEYFGLHFIISFSSGPILHL